MADPHWLSPWIQIPPKEYSLPNLAPMAPKWDHGRSQASQEAPNTFVYSGAISPCVINWKLNQTLPLSAYTLVTHILLTPYSKLSDPILIPYLGHSLTFTKQATKATTD